MSSRDWFYVKVHAADPEAIQELLQGPVPALVSALPDDVCRWFFLRWPVAGDSHLRLRFEGGLEALAEVETAAARHLGQPGHAFRYGLYEPETEKFGSPAGVRAAERLFHSSSELVLGLFDEGYWAERHAQALHLMVLSAELLPPGRRVPFLERYAAYWSGLPPRSPALRATVGRQRDRLLAGRADLVADRPERTDRLAALRDLLASAVDAAGPDETRGPEYALFHHLHLTDNRLGVPPRAEAVLACLATDLIAP